MSVKQNVVSQLNTSITHSLKCQPMVENRDVMLERHLEKIKH